MNCYPHKDHHHIPCTHSIALMDSSMGRIMPISSLASDLLSPSHARKQSVQVICQVVEIKHHGTIFKIDAVLACLNDDFLHSLPGSTMGNPLRSRCN